VCGPRPRALRCTAATAPVGRRSRAPREPRSCNNPGGATHCAVRHERTGEGEVHNRAPPAEVARGGGGAGGGGRARAALSTRGASLAPPLARWRSLLDLFLHYSNR